MTSDDRNSRPVFPPVMPAPTGRRPPPSARSRAIPMAMTLVGLAIVMITQAVQRGLIVGVEVSSPAYVVGGVLIVLGVMGIGRREETPASPTAKPDPARTVGPLAQSGREPDEADELEALRETLRQIQAERSRQHDPGHR